MLSPFPHQVKFVLGVWSDAVIHHHPLGRMIASGQVPPGAWSGAVIGPRGPLVSAAHRKTAGFVSLFLVQNGTFFVNASCICEAVSLSGCHLMLYGYHKLCGLFTILVSENCSALGSIRTSFVVKNFRNKAKVIWCTVS